MFTETGWGKIRDIAYRYGIDTSTRIVSYRKRKYRYSKNTAELGLVLSRGPPTTL
jgi:hypothetical protein